MSLSQKRLSLLPVAFAILALAQCGENPAGPSGGIELQGVVLEGPSSASAQSTGLSSQSATKSKITVTVEGTSISAKVSANGTFTLKNVPAGTFTLVFTRDGTVIGTIQISVVEGSRRIKVVVDASGTTVTLVSIDFETDQDEGEDQGDEAKTCLINGGKVGQGIELEGNVAPGSTSATSFMLDVKGNRASGLVSVNASGASFKCVGQAGKQADCQAQVKLGAQVHVRGTLTSCDMTAAAVTATEVKVQK
jgi:hypothetical protein